MGVSERRLREREQRRQSILDAAEQVFLLRGIESPTMEDVASAAEVSKGTVYLYFEGKDALFAAIAERKMSGVIERLQGRIAEATSGLEELRAALVTMSEHFLNRPDVVRMILGSLSSVRVDPQIEAHAGYREKIGLALGSIASLIERGKRDGSVRSDVEPLTHALQLWGSFMGVCLLYVHREEIARRIPMPVDLDALIPSFIEASLRALESPGTGARP